MNTIFLTTTLFLIFMVTVSPESIGSEGGSIKNSYLDIGVNDSNLYQQDFQRIDRNQIKNQIISFIPPLLASAVTQHAYTLPPSAFSLSLTNRFISLEGDDFFMNGDPNKAVFNDFKVDRHLMDLDVFYGFDLNRKYLHSFTLRINVPYLNTQTNGAVHPNGQQFISLENAGSSQEVGDIGLFLKKKLLDQGNSPIGLAVVGAVFLPTGANDETFGSNGRISAKRPQPPNLTAAQGFDAVQKSNVENGTWGDGRCFFTNFNKDNRTLCNDNPAFSAPSGVQSFSPGGANFDNAFVGDFPFNNGIFGRFSSDGRLPTTLQPGTGDYSYLLGIFLTRQFDFSSPVGRSALHLGLTHRFVSEEDGINFGDTSTIFATYVKPIYKDYIALDLTFVGFDHEDDSYSGKIPEPEIHTCESSDMGVIANCTVVGDEAFIFELHDRPSFSGGFTGLLAPSIIFSPDPQLRITLSSLFRVIDPDLGPAPDEVTRISTSYTF